MAGLASFTASIAAFAPWVAPTPRRTSLRLIEPDSTTFADSASAAHRHTEKQPVGERDQDRNERRDQRAAPGFDILQGVKKKEVV